MAGYTFTSLVLYLFLSIFIVFCYSSPVTFTREELLNIRDSLPVTSLPDFIEPESYTEILVGAAAAALSRLYRRRRRGKRAGTLIKLRQRGLRAPLPSIYMVNVRSMPEKIDELLLVNKLNMDFSRSAVLCFTETWLSESVPDDAFRLPNFQLFRADRSTELSRMSEGGGICFYINEGWCTDVTVLEKSCSPQLETVFLNCTPSYSPREFSSFILVGVYIPPQASMTEALETIADQVSKAEEKHPDSFCIILGDFNSGDLSDELPNYRQHIQCPTRGTDTVDHCYTTSKDSYRALPRPSLGLSDHSMLHLIPIH